MRLLKHPWRLVGIGLVLAVLATLGTSHWLLVDVAGIPKDFAELFLDVLKEVGVAFFIAGIAILSIEQARVKTFTEELTTEVDKKLAAIELATTDLVYRGPLPRTYYEKIKDDMLSPRFVRQEWVVRLEISWIDQLDPTHEFLEFNFQQEYEIQNVDSSTRKYPVGHFESCDWDWDPRFTNTTRIRYLRIYLAGAPILHQSAAPGASLGEREMDFMKVEHEIELPVESVLRVEEGSSKIMSARHLETRMISEPTMDLRLYVRYPEDLKVEIELPHVLLGGESFRQVSDEPFPGGKRETYWHVSRPLAPLTFFNIVWRKAQPARAASGGASSAMVAAPLASAPAAPAGPTAAPPAAATHGLADLAPAAPAAVAPVTPAVPAPVAPAADTLTPAAAHAPAAPAPVAPAADTLTPAVLQAPAAPPPPAPAAPTAAGAKAPDVPAPTAPARALAVPAPVASAPAVPAPAAPAPAQPGAVPISALEKPPGEKP